jgi:hypothetical protein
MSTQPETCTRPQAPFPRYYFKCEHPLVKMGCFSIGCVQITFRMAIIFFSADTAICTILFLTAVLRAEIRR